MTNVRPHDPDIRKLYLFNFFNGIAVSVASSYLLLDRLLLRLDLNMAQFGIIKGLSQWLPVVLNLFLTPWLMRLQRDRQIAAIGLMIRVMLPFTMLLLPLWTRDPRALTAGLAIILVGTMIFPVVAINSLQVLYKEHIPSDMLGKHLGGMTIVWFLPAYLSVIPCAWYLDRHSSGADAEFLWAFFAILLVTTVFQIPASWLVLRLSPPKQNASLADGSALRDIAEPFRETNFRKVLLVMLAISGVSAMIQCFQYPYLLQGQGLSTYRISFFDAALSIAAVVLLPLWGRITDRVGGRNVLRATLLGVAVGVFCLAGNGLAFVFVYAALAWNTSTGLFGYGMNISRQVVGIALMPVERNATYVAALSFVVGLGFFLGSIFGGWALDWLKLQLHAEVSFVHFRIFFALCATLFVLLAAAASTLRDGRPHLSAAEVALATWRAVRNRQGRA